MAQAATTMTLAELLKQTVDGNTIFKEKINDIAYKVNAAGYANENLSARIAQKSVNVIFADEKKLTQSDGCNDCEIEGNDLLSLPTILAYLWENVVNNIEKEGKNIHVLRAAKAILEAILRRKTYLAQYCTLSSVKSSSKEKDSFSAFPDLLLSMNDKTCRKAELMTPFIVIDCKTPGKLLIFNNTNDNLYKIWRSRGKMVITERQEGSMKIKKFDNKFKLLDPVLQIAGYMVLSGARVGMLLAYPRMVWFEIVKINEKKNIFNIKVYPLLKISSFEHGMLEIVRILKYASNLEPNKKFLRQKVDKKEEEVGCEEKKEEVVVFEEKKELRAKKRKFSTLQSDEKKIAKKQK
ncbi:hypothetical protein RFI_36128 [Reticulomyxa filosa]|uniref:Uncharacterized protein n=1 Tax=Reticulomyxa filosa TaxID=46433 RepID=X6LJJ5_RETFI|nr:hypothetical protein RFI_36128 [Reticulomyxa filosa]|eukprot:ETO01312.1 hypothetical protein RFI_36128 [Reticulomyxa filosa]